MDAKLLAKVFGPAPEWKGPLTVVVPADATLESVGGDFLVQGGVKVYSPRLFSGRITADLACLLPDSQTLLIIQQTRYRLQTGEEKIKQTLLAIDVSHVIAVEFADLSALEALGVPKPPIAQMAGPQRIG